MDWNQFDLNPKVIAALKKADIKSVKEILNLSGADLQRLMKLSSADIQCLLKTVSHTLRRDSMLTALQLYQDKDHLTSQHQKLSLGCSVLDNLLKGGIPLVGITELAGESSAGKTQISLQLCLCVQYPYKYGGLESVLGGWQQTKKIGHPLPEGYLSAILRTSVMADRMLAEFILYAHIHNGICRDMEIASGNGTTKSLESQPRDEPLGGDVHEVSRCRAHQLPSCVSSFSHFRAVYICTEDVFPSKRLQQLIEQQHRLRTDVPAEIVQKIRFGNSIFVEHAADLDAFHKCITKRISLLLARGMVRLVVIDSIAALFRCEFGVSDSVAKAQYLQTFGAQLHSLSTRFRTPIMCVNQVTDAVSELEAAQCGCSVVDKRVCPSLGITWANQLLMRLMVSRIPQPVQSSGVASHPTGNVRTLQVVFAPHLPPSFCYYTVKLEGVKGIK